MPTDKLQRIHWIYDLYKDEMIRRLCLARAALMWVHLESSRYRVRGVSNDTHAFLEINFDDLWYSYHPAGGTGEESVLRLPGQHSWRPPSLVAQSSAITIDTHKVKWQSCKISEINLITLPSGATLLVAATEFQAEQTIIKLLQQDGGVTTNPVVTYLALPENLNSYNKGLRLLNRVNGTITAEILTPLTCYPELQEIILQLQGRRLCIIVNLSLFSVSQLVQFNALFEIPGRVQNIILPANTCIVCIAVRGQYYQGWDFHRRIREDGFYDLDFIKVEKSDETTREKRQNDVIINLYGNDDLWVSRLLGTINYDAITKSASFTLNPHGLLNWAVAAKELSLQILINNPPDSKEFNYFWYNLIYLRQIVFQGLRYPIPSDWEIYSEQQPYFLPPELFKRCRFFRGLPAHMTDQVSRKIIVLNSFTFMKYAQRSEPLLPRNQEHHIVYCIENFTILQWSEFLSTLSGSVDIYLLKVELQPWMRSALVETETSDELEPWVRVYYAPQPYQFANCLASEDTYTVVLDGLEIIDLWLPERTGVSAGNLLQSFEKHEWRQLIFVGTPTFEVEQYLQQFILKYNSATSAKEKVIFITANQLWIKTIPYGSISQLMNMPTQHRSNSLSFSPVIDNESRIQSVQRAFINHPVVWIEGSTGVGKTSFAQIYLTSCFLPKLCSSYYEFSQVERWLQDATAGNPNAVYVLVINEGNLADAVLMGQLITLYLDHAYFIFNRKHYDLGPLNSPLRNRLKVLITANPLDYGSGRIRPAIYDLATRIVFGSFKFDYIKQFILLPNCQELSRKNLDRLQKLYEYASFKGVEITPRELVTLGKMLSYDKRNILFDDDVFYQVITTVLKTEDAKQFSEFLRPPLYTSPLRLSTRILKDNFKLFPSRQPVYDLLQRFLRLVETSHIEKSLPQSHLPIFLLEGPAGCGKSFLTQAVLAEENYRVITVNNFLETQFTSDEHICVQVPPSLDAEVRELFFEELLIKQVHLLWIDEVNAQQLDEQTLNRVLDTGLHIIATQNPAGEEYKDRAELSPALRHRSLRIILRNYTDKEMEELYK